MTEKVKDENPANRSSGNPASESTGEPARKSTGKATGKPVKKAAKKAAARAAGTPAEQPAETAAPGGSNESTGAAEPAEATGAAGAAGAAGSGAARPGRKTTAAARKAAPARKAAAPAKRTTAAARKAAAASPAGGAAAADAEAEASADEVAGNAAADGAAAGKADAGKTRTDKASANKTARADKTASADRADGKETSGKEAPAKATKAARESGTAAAATRARAVMQRRHRRLGFAMTTAIGVELAGAAGIVAGALLPWEWDERLIGRTDQAGIITQTLLGLTLLALLLAWLLRSDKARVPARVAVVLLGALSVVFAAAQAWRAEYGGREAGGLVTAVGALLVVAGAVGWLIAQRRLRVLFPFGLADARRTGYGNLPAVRRAQLIGGPVGAVCGIVVVAGAVLLFPSWVTTEDTQTASALDLTGPVPESGNGAPAWEIELAAAAREERPSTVHATAGGPVVDELQGVRGVHPDSGETRWQWRDQAYQRVASAVTDSGATVVLALTYDGDDAGRDRVVALDATTGEVRWDRYDDELVAAMTTALITGQDGDWFVVPQQGEPPADAAQAAPVSLMVYGAGDGELRYEATEGEGCRFVNAAGAGDGTVVTTEECTVSETASECHVSGLDPVTGDEVWTWPAAGAEPASGCQTNGTPELLFITYESGEIGEDGAPPPTATVALDPATGTQAWLAGPEQEGEGRGLGNAVVIGDAVAGTEFVDDGQGGGNGVMIVRNAADGTLRSEVDLPPGQPVGVVPAGENTVMVPVYAPTTGAITLVQFDVAAGARTGVAPVSEEPPATATIQWIEAEAGPDSLTVGILVTAGGGETGGTPSYDLRVYGW